MNRVRSLPSVLISLLVLSVLGAGVTEFYIREGGGGILGHWFGIYIGQPANPFPGRIFAGPTGLVLGWLIGLIVLGLIVWAVMHSVARRTDDATATFLGIWLGTILGAAGAGLVVAMITFNVVLNLPGGFGAGQYFQALTHGLYWGMVAGLIAALVGTQLGRPTSTFADSLNPPLP